MIQHKIKMEMNMVNKLKRVSSVLATVLIVVFAFSSCTKKSGCGEIDGFHGEGIFEYYKNPVPIGARENHYSYVVYRQAVLIYGEGEDADTCGFVNNTVPLSYRKPGISRRVFVTAERNCPSTVTTDHVIKDFRLRCIEELD